jgi:hypothetical protein
MGMNGRMFRVIRSGYLPREEMEKAFSYPELVEKLAGHEIMPVLCAGGDYSGKYRIEDEQTEKVIAREITSE